MFQQQRQTERRHVLLAMEEWRGGDEEALTVSGAATCGGMEANGGAGDVIFLMQKNCKQTRLILYTTALS